MPKKNTTPRGENVNHPDNYYQDLINQLDQGFCIFDMLFDDDGYPVDYRFVEYNRAFERHTGLSNGVGKTIRELLPDQDKHWFETFGRVAITGQPTRITRYGEALRRWIEVYAFRVGEPEQFRVAALFSDVTTEKKAELDLQASKDLDNSALRQAEERMHRMEIEQQLEIFKVSLETLEEERHRISESLHNGVGQILYGVKISLSGLDQDASREEYFKTKTYTDKLLSEAIRETRRVSHELMPVTLDEFGLKTAIEDIGRQLKDGVQFNFHFKGLNRRLERYLELAVYRTVQELMTNIVKHAEATKASVAIALEAKDIKIKVEDNGQGMSTSGNHKSGIGLSSIKSKIKLLNGEVDISSSAGSGTQVTIVIPLPN